jgi:hypothetical protein
LPFIQQKNYPIGSIRTVFTTAQSRFRFETSRSRGYLTNWCPLHHIGSTSVLSTSPHRAPCNARLEPEANSISPLFNASFVDTLFLKLHPASAVSSKQHYLLENSNMPSVRFLISQPPLRGIAPRTTGSLSIRLSRISASGNQVQTLFVFAPGDSPLVPREVRYDRSDDGCLIALSNDERWTTWLWRGHCRSPAPPSGSPYLPKADD